MRRAGLLLLVLFAFPPALAATTSLSASTTQCYVDLLLKTAPWPQPCPTLRIVATAGLTCSSPTVCTGSFAALVTGTSDRPAGAMAVEASLDDRPDELGTLRICSQTDLDPRASCSGSLTTAVPLLTGACLTLWINARLTEDAVVWSKLPIRAYLCNVNGGTVALSVSSA